MTSTGTTTAQAGVLTPPRLGGIRKAIAKGDEGKHKIAAEFGVGSGTVARIKGEMTGVNPQLTLRRY
jgi:hypothetical protein